MNLAYDSISANVFLIDENEDARNARMSICAMIRGLNVYGCECPEDAAKLSRTVAPDIIVADLYGKGEDSFEKTLELSRSRDGIFTAVVCRDKDIETFRGRFPSGVTFLTEPVSDDGFLYLIKNFSDVVKNRRSEEKSRTENRNCESGVFLWAGVIEGYNDVMRLHRAIGAKTEGSSGSLDNLTYIRVFSFLYDFLVKSFLKDLKVTVGAAAEGGRVMIVFMADDAIKSVLREGVFYETAEKYISFRGDWCEICMRFSSSPPYAVVDSANFLDPDDTGRTGLPRFADAYSQNGSRLNQPFLSETAEYYSGISDIFLSLACFIKNYSQSFEGVLHWRDIYESLAGVDSAIEDYMSEEKKSGGETEKERNVYFAVLKLYTILYFYGAR